jgi:hypothetical protein
MILNILARDDRYTCIVVTAIPVLLWLTGGIMWEPGAGSSDGVGRRI